LAISFKFLFYRVCDGDKPLAMAIGRPTEFLLSLGDFSIFF
jgi:hypothetical protein